MKESLSSEKLVWKLSSSLSYMFIRVGTANFRVPHNMCPTEYKKLKQCNAIHSKSFSFFTTNVMKNRSFTLTVQNE